MSEANVDFSQEPRNLVNVFNSKVFFFPKYNTVSIYTDPFILYKKNIDYRDV